MGFTEQELSIQITDLNVVIISAMYFSLSTATNTHQSKSFNKFTAECAGTDHESFYVSKFLLNLATINLNLVVVSAIHRCSVHWSFRKCFENVIVKPLFKRCVFTSKFNNFLSNYTTEKCALRYKGACCKISCFRNNRVFKFLH